MSRTALIGALILLLFVIMSVARWRRGSILRRLKELEPHKRVHVLRTTGEMDRFLDSVSDA